MRTEPQRRKPRGAHIDETEFMKALEKDPAAAMQALADEAVSDWEENARPQDKGMVSAEVEV